MKRIWVEDETHRILKAMASLRNMKLSELTELILNLYTKQYLKRKGVKKL